MKITVLSKPEEKVSKKGTKYWQMKVCDEDLKEKQGNYFGDTEPVIDQEYEVEEKFNEEYKSFSWFSKKDNKKGGFPSKPSPSVDQQIRIVALQESVKQAVQSSQEYKSTDIIRVAQYFETYIREGKV